MRYGNNTKRTTAKATQRNKRQIVLRREATGSSRREHIGDDKTIVARAPGPQCDRNAQPRAELHASRIAVSRAAGGARPSSIWFTAATSASTLPAPTIVSAAR